MPRIRIVRYDVQQPCRTAPVDVRKPGSRRNEDFKVIGGAWGSTRRCRPATPPAYSGAEPCCHATSKRSAFITLFQAATKSFTNFGWAPVLA